MRKKLSKLFVVLNAFVLFSILSVNSFDAKAAVQPQNLIYISGDTDNWIRQIQGTYYFGNNHQSIDIRLGTDGSTASYNVSIGNLSYTNIRSEYLRNVNLSSLREGSYILTVERVQDTGSSSTNTYNVVIDRRGPSLDGRDLFIEGSDRTYDYSGGSVDVDFRSESSSDIYRYNVYFRNKSGNLIQFDTLDADETSFRFRPSSVGMGIGRYDIEVYAVDRAGNLGDSLENTIDIDYDDRSGEIRDVENITNIEGTILSGSDIANAKFKNNQTIYLTAGTNSISFVHDRDLNGRITYRLTGPSGFSATPSTPTFTNLAAGSYTLTITNTYTPTVGTNAEKNATFTFTVAAVNTATTTNDYYVTDTTYVPSSNTVTKSSTINAVITAVNKSTISFAKDISFYSVGSSAVLRGSVDDLNRALRTLGTSGATVVKAYDANYNLVVNQTITMPDAGTPILGGTGSIDIPNNDLVDINPAAGVTADLNVSATGITAATGNVILFRELYIDGRLAQRKAGTTNFDRVTYRSSSEGDQRINVEVIYYSSSGSSNAVNDTRSVKREIRIDESSLAYGIVDYTYATRESITVSATIFDPSDILRNSRLVLYRGNAIVEEVEIEAGTTVYTFEGLSSATSYRVQIEGESRRVDYGDRESILNGEYIDDAIPYTNDYNIDTLGSQDQVQITNVSLDYDRARRQLEVDVFYDILGSAASDELDVRVERFINEDYDDINNRRDENYEEELSISTRLGSSRDSFDVDNILADEFYRITITDGRTLLYSGNFYPTVSRPTASIKIEGLTNTTAEFRIDIEENDSDLDRAFLYIYEARDDFEDYIIRQEARDGRVNAVSGLDRNTDYIAEIRANYDGPDNTFFNNQPIGRISFTTGAVSPTVKLTNVVSSDTSIFFDYQLDDPQNMVVDARAQLYRDGRAVSGQFITLRRGSDTRLEFRNVSPDNEYEIRIEMSYKLPGSDDVVDTKNYVNPDGTPTNQKVHASRLVPVAEVSNIVISHDRIGLDVFIKDPFNSFQSANIRVVEKGFSNPIVNRTVNREQSQSFVLDGLKPGREYQVIINTYYRTSSTSRPTLVTIYSKDFTTLKELDALYQNVKIDDDSLSLDVFIANALDYKIYTELILDGDVVERRLMDTGNNRLNFARLISGETYNLRTYAVDNNDREIAIIDANYKIKSESILVKPEFTVTSTIKGNTITFKVLISDPDDLIAPSVIKLVATGSNGQTNTKEFSINQVTSNSNTFEYTLPYDNASVNVSVSYEDADGDTQTIDHSFAYQVTTGNNSNTLTYAVIALLTVSVVAMSVVLINTKKKNN